MNYALPAKWLKAWKIYCSWNYRKFSSPISPGTINLGSLYNSDGELKEKLRSGVDYVGVDEFVYLAFQQIYGADGFLAYAPNNIYNRAEVTEHKILPQDIQKELEELTAFKF